MSMPTPDPSLLPSVVTTVSGLFTDNWDTFVGAAIALIGIVVIPVVVIRGGLRLAIRGLRRVFGAAS
jgi:hypothetical protein